MILVMKPDATALDIEATVKQIKDWGHTQVSINPGQNQTIIGIIGDKQDLQGRALKSLPGVDKMLEISAPYKKASREFHPSDTIIDVNGVKIGGGYKSIIAGPCSVDTEEITVKLIQVPSIKGTVTLDGKPLNSAFLYFQGNKNYYSASVFDGKFELKAKPGKYIVTCTDKKTVAVVELNESGENKINFDKSRSNCF